MSFATKFEFAKVLRFQMTANGELAFPLI